MIDRNPSHLLGQKVTLVGVAYDAHSGAMLLLSDETPVYISGLDCWDDQWDRKKLHVSGTLTRKELAPDPEVSEKGEHSHGMLGSSLIISDATWTEA
jgi:hypothetical protein